MRPKYTMLVFILIGHIVGFFMIAGSQQVEVPSWLNLIGVAGLWIPLLFIPFFRSPKGLLLLTILGVCALLFETASIKTGFPYSFFEYGNDFGFKIFNAVPWSVFFGWTPLVIATTTIAKKVFEQGILLILGGALLLVLFDLVFDPVATQQEFWMWQTQGMYYKVPFQNFVGWFLTGVIGTWVTTKFMPVLKEKTHIYLFVFSLSLWSGAALTLSFILPTLLGWGYLLFVWNIHK